ncbi:MAG: hypothetical protein IJB61_07840 [Bacteroides sp]|nr:hypothetical protein [Bacteroides sp.]
MTVVLASCSQEEQLGMNNEVKSGFIGTMEKLDSRIALDGNDMVVWSEGDEVSIFEGYNINSLYKVSNITDAIANFEFVSYTAPEEMVDLGCNYAIYPYDKANTVSTEGIITAPIESEITYSKDNIIDKALMVAKSDGYDLNFTNAQGILLLRLNAQIPIKWGKIISIKLTSNAENKYLSGTATMDYSTSTDGKPVAKITANGSTYLNVTLADDLQLLLPGTKNGEYADYYIPMVPGTYEAGKLTLTIIFEGNKTYTTTNSKDITISRSSIQPLKHTLSAGEFTGEIEGLCKVQSAEDLLKWAWLVNNEDNTLGLKLENNIEMLLFTIEEDAANKTYKFTETPITVEDGVPSGSNWIPVCGGLSSLSEAYSGHIEGNNKTIKGLRVVENTDQVGFIGAMYDDASIQNLVIEDAVIKGGDLETGAAVGRSHNGTLVKNVHVKNSTIKGKEDVGGVAGLNYRRIKPGIDEKISIMENCTTDKDTQVLGTGSQVGGICGNNNGALVINCINNADVTGKSNVGGVCGQSREYNTGVSGYLIASGSTAEATITATGSEGVAGGIVGWTVIDPNHNVNEITCEAVVIASYSLSTVSANSGRAGAIIGSSDYSIIRSSWGAKKGTTKACGLSAPTYHGAYAFNAENEVTQEKINEMNKAISHYNTNETGIYEYTCPYTWEIGADGWPILK